MSLPESQVIIYKQIFSKRELRDILVRDGVASTAVIGRITENTSLNEWNYYCRLAGRRL